MTQGITTSYHINVTFAPQLPSEYAVSDWSASERLQGVHGLITPHSQSRRHAPSNYCEAVLP